MAEHESKGHPELELLAEWAAGALAHDAEETAAVERHLSDCPTCRLEVGRLRRFAALDTDPELATEAGWPRAERALARAYREKIVAEIGRGDAADAAPTQKGRLLRLPVRSRWPRLERSPGSSSSAPSPGSSPERWWAVPAAVAAILVLVLLNLPGRQGHEGPPDLTGPRRGVGPAAREIVLDVPTGELTQPPHRFAWHVEKRFDTYGLEVVTPELERVFHQTGIVETAFVVSDTMRGLLAPGRIYLWSVHGYRGLTVEAVSAHAWFKMPPGSPRR